MNGPCGSREVGTWVTSRSLGKGNTAEAVSVRVFHFPSGLGRFVQEPPPGWSVGVSVEDVKVPGLRLTELGVRLPPGQSFLGSITLYTTFVSRT